MLHLRNNQEITIKTLYLIRHAKSKWDDGKLQDFERGLSSRGESDLNIMSSYISLRQITPDLMLSSSALRAQLTADVLAKRLNYRGRIHYMSELYMVRPKTLINILGLQENQHESIFLIGHNPELTELANELIEDNLSKLPTLGIIAISLDIDSWSDIENASGKMKFFVYPKQFRYYMPREIKKYIEDSQAI